MYGVERGHTWSMQCMMMMGPIYRMSLIRLEESIIYSGPIPAGDPVMIKRGMGGIKLGTRCEAKRNQ